MHTSAFFFSFASFFFAAGGSSVAYVAHRDLAAVDVVVGRAKDPGKEKEKIQETEFLGLRALEARARAHVHSPEARGPGSGTVPVLSKRDFAARSVIQERAIIYSCKSPHLISP